MSRWLGLFALVVTPFLSCSGLGAADKSPPTRRVVCLACREVDRIDRHEFPPPLLARELVRQAFLIAARDECGHLTRDQSLREEFPPSSDPRAVLLDLFVTTQTAKKGVDYCYTLARGSGKTAEKLWDWKDHVDVPVAMIMIKTPASITALAERAEVLSRGPLKDLLKREASGPSVPAPEPLPRCRRGPKRKSGPGTSSPSWEGSAAFMPRSVKKANRLSCWRAGRRLCEPGHGHGVLFQRGSQGLVRAGPALRRTPRASERPLGVGPFPPRLCLPRL